MGQDCSCLREPSGMRTTEMLAAAPEQGVQAQEQEEPKQEEGNLDVITSLPQDHCINTKKAAKGYIESKKYSELSQNRLPSGFAAYEKDIESYLPKKVAKVLNKNWEFNFEEEIGDSVEELPPMINVKENYIYHGQWLKRKHKHGQGRQIFSDGTMFVGYFFKDKLNGKGLLVEPDGLVYQGEFKDGKANGFGELKKPDGSKYKGEFSEDMQEGQGKEIWPDGSYYEGEYHQNEKHGKGKMVWSEQNYYEGEFANNKLEGKGTYVWGDGKKYVGEWRNGKMHGKGVFSWPDGGVYEGEYKEDMKNGQGVMKWKDGRVYDGTWVDGKKHGKAKFTFIKKGTPQTKMSRWEDDQRIEWIKA